MKTVAKLRVVAHEDAPVPDLPDLPEELRLALVDVAGAAREGAAVDDCGRPDGGDAGDVRRRDQRRVWAEGQARPGPGRGALQGRAWFGGAGWPASAGDAPRARTTDGAEVPLAAYRLFAAEDQLSSVVMERMLAGLATRRHVAAGEPVGVGVQERAMATSRSAVSRRFIVATRTALAKLLARDPTPFEYRGVDA